MPFMWLMLTNNGIFRHLQTMFFPIIGTVERTRNVNSFPFLCVKAVFHLLYLDWMKTQYNHTEQKTNHYLLA